MMRIIGLFLAAGNSSRMGTDKRCLPVSQVPMGSMALEQAVKSELDHVLVVTREKDALDWVRKDSCKWSHLPCRSYGIGDSIRCGLQAALDLEADAVMILLADQPFITPDIINTLIHTYQKHPEFFFVAAGNNQQIPMPPVLFSKSSYPFLLQLAGDQGARHVIRKKLQHEGKVIQFQEPLFFYDVDTYDDYFLLLERIGER
jgi:molybdenum cofactor cytidylyltransferase